MYSGLSWLLRQSVSWWQALTSESSRQSCTVWFLSNGHSGVHPRLSTQHNDSSSPTDHELDWPVVKPLDNRAELELLHLYSVAPHASLLELSSALQAFQCLTGWIDWVEGSLMWGSPCHRARGEAGWPSSRSLGGWYCKCARSRLHDLKSTVSMTAAIVDLGRLYWRLWSQGEADWGIHCPKVLVRSTARQKCLHLGRLGTHINSYLTYGIFQFSPRINSRWHVVGSSAEDL